MSEKAAVVAFPAKAIVRQTPDEREALRSEIARLIQRLNSYQAAMKSVSDERDRAVAAAVEAARGGDQATRRATLIEVAQMLRDEARELPGRVCGDSRYNSVERGAAEGAAEILENMADWMVEQ